MIEIPKLFGTSGIRGKYNEKITLELAINVARSLASYIGGKDHTVIIGRDPRTTGKIIENVMVSALLECGCNVLNLGMVPTPVVGYATLKLKGNAGIMITASHNPSPDNGIKLWNPNGMAYKQDQEREIERLVYEKTFKPVNWSEIGSEYDISWFTNEYLDDLLNIVEINKEKPLKVVVDCANGAGSYLSPILLRKAGCNVVAMNAQPDGFFPGRNPEPSEANLKELKDAVKSIGADVGIAHDGDADRMIAVDEKGNVADFDKLLALISTQFGGNVVTTVDASACIDTCMHKIGGSVIRTPVGDVHVAEAINKHNATFGGEPSGSWLHPDFCMCPDGLLSGLRIIEIIQKKGKLSKLLNDIENYPTIRSKITCENKDKTSIMNKVEAEFSNCFDDIKEITNIDGTRLSFNDGSWVLIRPSGTEPYIRITAEGKTSKHLEKINKISVDFLKSCI
ncbi:MAG: phosphoglucosamine mutase [Methanobacteriaceae archaeon]|nr:phosphoglucosamine mutase [Methanobacteriaceae archaeon]